MTKVAYNQGPGTLLKVLTFQGGTLVSIEDGARIDTNIDHGTNVIVSRGDLQADVYRKYGLPAYREFVDENLERWIYDVGQGAFLKVLLFQCGRLVDIKERRRPYRRLLGSASEP